MSLYMESTQISAVKTAGEIQALLVHAGANRIMTEYDSEKKLKGLSFSLMVKGAEVPFCLPARLDPVFRYIQRKVSPSNRAKRTNHHMAQAERVAWRQLLRWIQAQLAMIETGMVAAEEVFLPYVQTAPNQTLYERMISSEQLSRLALTSAKEALD